jgi:hypothetical protein
MSEEKMKIMFFVTLVISTLLMSTSCAGGDGPPTINPTNHDTTNAMNTLIDFMKNLHEGRYVEAATLYGGTYEIMQDHNPGVDPNDHPLLIKNACEINGAQCLLVKSVTLEQKDSTSGYTFRVEFQNEDGSLFVQGPCCGGNETDTPSKSVFMITVIEDDDANFLVMDMPPYLP